MTKYPINIGLSVVGVFAVGVGVVVARTTTAWIIPFRATESA